MKSPPLGHRVMKWKRTDDFENLHHQTTLFARLLFETRPVLQLKLKAYTFCMEIIMLKGQIFQ